MQLQLDIWLERYDPCITLRDAYSGRIVLVWEADIVRRRLARGDLCLEDLCDTDLSCAERLGLMPEIQDGPVWRRCKAADQSISVPGRILGDTDGIG